MTTQDDLSKDDRRRFAGGPFTAVHQTRAEANGRKHVAHLFAKTAADAMAADTTAERTCAFKVPSWCLDGIRVTKLTVLPQAACTGHDDNHATITFAANGGSGARTTVATISTDTNGGGASWVAFAAIDATLSATPANLVVAVGGLFTVAIAKGGSGVVVPIFDAVLEYEEV